MRRALAPALAFCLLAAGPAYAVSRHAAFANTEPLAAKQWYLTQDKAWDFWTTAPTLAPVRVAIIDSGIDADHPEFAGRIAAGKSFVAGSSWKVDTDGHGTFVAGIVAANPSNSLGIAGLAFNAKLLIAKVVDPEGDVLSLTAETNAIYWAVAHGARVINLSFGAARDPGDPQYDGYSPLERKAIEYATSRGVLIVAAAGNGTDAPKMPWDFADYPAALPHVLGVSALNETGGVPTFSNRDALFVDLAAPGVGIFSTVPRNLVDTTVSGCDGQPYSECGPDELRQGDGTSFAAPQVAAAAALLLGVDPKLTVDQVEWLLERSATDDTPKNGCATCLIGRDSLTGWGRLDVDRALTWLQRGVPALPTPDAYEPNDDAGSGVSGAHPVGAATQLSATLDYWDDPIDVYSIALHKGERLYARLSGSQTRAMTMIVWKPHTTQVDSVGGALRGLLSESALVGAQQRLSFRAPAAGTYYVEVKLGGPPKTKNVAAYSLALSRSAT